MQNLQICEKRRYMIILWSCWHNDGEQEVYLGRLPFR